MTTELVPVFAGEIAGVSVQLVDARLLHGFLEVGRRYASWITERIEEYGFVQDQDFLVSQNREIKSGRGGDRRSKDYHITIGMAKELAMVERNDKGREVRRYFIECERQLFGLRAPYALKDLRSKKALPGGLTLDQQDAIKALVKSRVDALPEDRRAKAAITCWSALKSKFGCSYKLIPPAQFGEALSLIARLDLGDASQDLLGAMRLANSPGALAGRRFLIRFSPGGDHYTASPVPEQAAVLTLRGFLRAVADPNGLLFPMDDTDLMFDAVESLQRMLRLRHAYFNRIGRA